MNIVKGGLSLIGTAVIAGWVAFAVSAPRNLDNAMNQPMEALGGNSIAEEMGEAKAEAYAVQCEEITAHAEEAWNRAVDNDTLERDAQRLEALDRQKQRFCNR